jgi:nitrile hydratase
MTEEHGHHHPHEITDAEARARALESLLLEKGMMTAEAIDVMVSAYETDIGPLNGAKVVAKAWSDSDYRKQLLEHGTEAIAELGFAGMQGEHMVVVENTPRVHNVVVCTLCSCYPWPTLGLPPVWYKAPPYRSRMVIEPREVLKEFGTQLPPDVEIRVWDSSAEIRYMVLPERPQGTEGMSADELAKLVTRDSMIGVTQAKAPAAAAR